MQMEAELMIAMFLMHTFLDLHVYHLFHTVASFGSNLTASHDEYQGE
jgi:hypothetical protein